MRCITLLLRVRTLPCRFQHQLDAGNPTNGAIRRQSQFVIRALATLIASVLFAAASQLQAAAWGTNAPMLTPRAGHSATLLPDGTILVAGGSSNSIFLSSAEIYNPTTGAWTGVGDMNSAHYAHTATLLTSGKVLIVGGYGAKSNRTASAELYDPASGTWSLTGSLNAARVSHRATLMANGQVLVEGGTDGTTTVASAELYDPVGGTWTLTGSLNAARQDHTATLLRDGTVLVTAGDAQGGSILSSSEVYDPVSATWTSIKPLNHARNNHTASLLPNGQVLVVGGSSGAGGVGIAELYDPAAGTWTDSGSLANPRYDHTATLLPNGLVLVAGGTSDGTSYLSLTELYDPRSGTWTNGNSLGIARDSHAATLLASGKVLAAGGRNSTIGLSSTELYDPATGAWASTTALSNARKSHTATLMPDGTVLVTAGTIRSDIFLSSCELYDPIAATWKTINSLNNNRYDHTATLLPNGQVLVAGGALGPIAVSLAERFDPTDGTWTNTKPLVTARYAHTATLLTNGLVLLTGGTPDGFTYLSSAELFHPATDSWTATGPMSTAHAGHSATLLADGKVLIAGGWDGVSIIKSAELYDSSSGAWTNVAGMNGARFGHTATLLPSGRVLVAGGQSSSGTISAAEIYDPSTETWTATAPMNTARVGHTATLLLSGEVLVTGGTNSSGSVLASTELYDPISGQWTSAGAMTNARVSHRATLLINGKVLLEGGSDASAPLASAELYDAGLGFDPSWQPQIATIPSASTLGSTLRILGAKFRGISEASGGNGAQNSPSDFPVVQLRSFENEQTLFLLSTSWSSNSVATEAVLGFPAGYVLATAFVNGIPSTGGVLKLSVAGPTVTFVSPTNGATLGAGNNAPLQVLAQDSAGTITQVSFFADNTNLLGVITKSPFNGVWTNVPLGKYTLTAVVSDDQGLGSRSAEVNITVVPVNHAPSFLKGPDISIAQNAGPQSVTNWATAISAGPTNEAGQQLQFVLTNDNAGLFLTQPALDTNGLLTFTPAPNTTGVARVSIILKDDGGTAYGGQDTSGVQIFTITIQPINQPPSFTKGPDVTVNEDAGAQVLTGWATAISPGPPAESAQTVAFTVTNDNSLLFLIQPAISTNGTLTFTTSTNANGIAHVTVVLMDNGGTADGGQDTSAPQSFTITVQPVNDPPSFIKGADVTVNEDAGAQVLAGWATAISPGPPDEAAQMLSFIVTNDNSALFLIQPAISTNGTLTFTTSTNANGIAHVTVLLMDNGGTANGGQDTSAPQSFIITVQPVNDPPSFINGADVVVNEDAGAQTLAGWATAISPGPPDEAAQTLSFIVTNDNSGLFAIQPSISTNGTLTFTTATNANGVAHLTAVLKDSGGTANGGQDTSAPQSFSITVQPVNDPPSFTKGADITVNENAGPQVIAGWATAISAGPPDEASQTLTFITTNDNSGLFSASPSVGTNGTLTFTPAASAIGVAHVSVLLKDSGGTANGGQDTSTPQTFIINIVGITNTQPGDVAIILGSAAADLSALTNDISEVSLPTIPFLSWDIFQRGGLTFQALSQYKLLVWYDPEGTEQVTSDEVSLLKSLYTNGIPILFAGPSISSAAAGLPADSQAPWQSLVHLVANGGSSTNGSFVPSPDALGDPLLNGAYGPVGTFLLETNLDQAAVTSDAESLAQLNGGDVFVIYPSANDPNQGQVRLVTQLFSLDSPGDTNSYPMRKSLFQNAVCWLLHCGACSAVFPAVGFEIDPMLPQTGAPAILNMTVGNSGECDAVACVTTVRLADGLKFVSATSDYGRIMSTNQTVTLFVGRLPARQSLAFAITFLPQVPGWFTNEIDIQTASTSPQSREAAFEVSGNALPQWVIERGASNAVLLRLVNAASGASYVVQQALLQGTNTNYFWTTLTNFTFTPPEFDLTDQIQPTNAAALYRVVPQ